MAEVSSPTTPSRVKSVNNIVNRLRKMEPQEFVFRLLSRYPTHQEAGPQDLQTPVNAAFSYRESDYPARLTIPMGDDIYWPYLNGVPVPYDQDMKEVDKESISYMPRSIRYIVGARSIFVDEQEANTDAYKFVDGRNRLVDNEMNRTKLTFEKGEIRGPSSDRILKQFLECRNDCKNQNKKCQDPFGRRAKSLNATYEMIDTVANDERSILLSELRTKAFNSANSASEAEMMPHAKFLNISFTHPGTNEEKDKRAIRAEYANFAYNNAQVFLESFADPRVKLIFQIGQLVEDGVITIGGINIGQAHWREQGSLIAQLPQGPEAPAPVTFLAELALTKAGEQFANELRAFNK